MRPSGICVFWESVNRDTNDPHQISTLAGCQHGPHRKVVVHGCEYRLRVRPRILWIWTLVGKGRCEAFQIVGDRKDRANPVLEVCEPAERKEIRNPFLVIRANVTQEPQELNKASVTPRRHMTRTPKVRLRKLFGDHLQVMQRMALRDALATKQRECIVVRSGLFPPEILITIHCRSESRRQATNSREGRVLSSGSAPIVPA